MKSAKTEPTTKANGTESLVGIAKIVLAYRGTAKPNLAEIGRIVGRASSLLKIADMDEKFEMENRAAVQVAKELGLMAKPKRPKLWGRSCGPNFVLALSENDGSLRGPFFCRQDGGWRS
jgi:hypothetical protein